MAEIDAADSASDDHDDDDAGGVPLPKEDGVGSAGGSTVPDRNGPLDLSGASSAIPAPKGVGHPVEQDGNGDTSMEDASAMKAQDQSDAATNAVEAGQQDQAEKNGGEIAEGEGGAVGESNTTV